MDIYEIITDKIIKELENGVIPWKKDWSSACINYESRKGYNGINAMLLRKPGEYLTFNQIKKFGGTVKKGAKASSVVFYKMYKFNEGTDDEKTVPLPIKYYSVFHLSDTEGIESKLANNTKEKKTIDEVEKIVTDYAESTKLKIEYIEQNEAYYKPLTDTVTMPLVSQFNSIEGYYTTLFHELSHSTGHKKRLNRSGITDKAAFGSETYSKEELIAEIGSAMVCSCLGIETDIKNTAAYIQSWLKVLKSDNKMLISSSNKAQNASNLILNIKK